MKWTGMLCSINREDTEVGKNIWNLPDLFYFSNDWDFIPNDYSNMVLGSVSEVLCPSIPSLSRPRSGRHFWPTFLLPVCPVSLLSYSVPQKLDFFSSKRHSPYCTETYLFDSRLDYTFAFLFVSVQTKCGHSPCGRPSQTSNQSYLQSPSPTSRGSFSRSKVRKVRVMSMRGGAMIM